MRPMTRMLSLALALSLPLCAHGEDDSRRWIEDITKMHSIPLADAARLDAGFTRPAIEHTGDVAAAALAWAETDVLQGGVYQTKTGDLSLFVMQDGESWLATLTHGEDTVLLTLDAKGRLLGYSCMDDPIAFYEGDLPGGTDEAILSYITHFARMNGSEAVTGYERQAVRWDGSGYDVRVTASALLDGTPCTFTISLETMAFTEVDCPLPAGVQPATEAMRLVMTTPVPAAYETFQVTLGGETVAVRAIDRRTQGDAFSQWPEDARSREEVFAIALQALMDETGLTLADVTAEPFIYGYDAESDMHRWQLNFDAFATPSDGYEYAVYIRDSDGAVLGVWGPEEANG